MRRVFVLALLVLSFLPAQAALAAETTANVFNDIETWDDGSYGSASGRIWSDDQIEFTWRGYIHVNGGPLERAAVYVEGSLGAIDPNDIYRQRCVKSARLVSLTEGWLTIDRFDDDYDAGSGEALIKVRWVGYGPITKAVTVATDGLRQIHLVRSAAVTGRFGTNYLELPGTSFDMGTGVLGCTRTRTSFHVASQGRIPGAHDLPGVDARQRRG